jgi:phosphate/sulfate permease
VPDPTPADERFELKPAPPVRAMAISAIGAVVGAGLIVLAAAQDWSLVIVIIGIAVLIFAVSLAVTAALLVRRLRTVIVAGSDELTVLRGRQSRSVAWSVIDKVNLRGPRLTVITRNGGGANVVVTNPRTPDDPTFLALIAAVRRRLDVDRGYQPLE